MTNFSAIDSMIRDSKGNVYVGRESGWVGSGQTYKITLNGKEIGVVGAGETVVGELVSGLNVIHASFYGILDFDSGSDIYSFEASEESNKFLIVTTRTNGLVNSLRFMEVTESSFEHAMR